MSDKFFMYVDNFMIHNNVKSNLIFGKPNREDKLFTIAIPTFQRPELLENALNSAINQTEITDYEIVIVDNNKNDSKTKEIVKKYLNDQIYYYQNDDNIGMFGNWNRCIELAKGKYITILNDDDWLSENFLNKCMKYLEPEVDGLYFRSNVVDLRQNIINYKSKYLMLKKLIKFFSKKKKKITLFDFFLGNKSAGTLGVLMRTEYLKKLGGYNREYFPSSDYVLHANYCLNYNVYFINEKMNYYRIAENESAKQGTMQKWEKIDNDIRKYFIRVIGKHKKLLNYLNVLIQENRVEGLEKQWNYKTTFIKKHNISRKIFKKIVALKNYLNI